MKSTYGSRGALPFKAGSCRAGAELRCWLQVVGVRGERALLPAEVWDPARRGASLADAERGWGLGVQLCRVPSRLRESRAGAGRLAGHGPVVVWPVPLSRMGR